MALDDFDDQTLIQLVQDGNQQAFGVLVKRYMQRAYFVALGLVGCHDDALDLSQDAFVRCYRAIKRFDKNREFFTWFYQILRNLCFNFLRDRKPRVYRFTEIPEEEIILIQADADLQPDIIFEKQEQSRELWSAIQALPEPEKEVIILREFQNMSYQEIASVLSCPVGTVMSRLYYARKCLAQVLRGTA